ncbi:MAG: hypothetical protein U0452_08690 [Anaerolineae bacterium]
MSDRAYLADRLNQALTSGDASALEDHMLANSHLPGPRGNLELLDAFANAVGDVLNTPNPPLPALVALLERWAAYPAPVTEPGVMLPCAAALARGQVAASVPGQWPEQLIGLERAAQDQRWRVRELAAAGLQRMLRADWERTCRALLDWARSPNPLIVRAAVAGVAEPPLLKRLDHADQALDVQQRAVESLQAVPVGERRSEPVRTLRQALGYTLSVIVVGSPVAGFDLLMHMARSDDADLRWVVQENLKKGRLRPWSADVARVQAELHATSTV